MSVLPRIGSAGNGPAYRPLLGGGQSASFWFELEQNRSELWVLFQIVLRTVRPLGSGQSAGHF